MWRLPKKLKSDQRNFKNQVFGFWKKKNFVGPSTSTQTSQLWGRTIRHFCRARPTCGGARKLELTYTARPELRPVSSTARNPRNRCKSRGGPASWCHHNSLLKNAWKIFVGLLLQSDAYYRIVITVYQLKHGHDLDHHSNRIIHLKNSNCSKINDDNAGLIFYGFMKNQPEPSRGVENVYSWAMTW